MCSLPLGFHTLETIRNALSEHGRVRMVVIAGEIGGRWSEETKAFLWSLACEKSRSEAIVLRGSVRAAWYRKWCKGSCFGRSWSVVESLEFGDDLPTAHVVVAATFREV